MSEIHLQSLPTELCHAVFLFLDPIGLIAASQTCNKFRDIIRPTHFHLAERLLALELTEEHGGIIPQFYSRTSRVSPPWDHKSWEDMRWACTHCLRLLHHRNFDNRSLLRLGYRKPQPGSIATKYQSGVTSWTPTRKRQQTHKTRQQRAQLTAERHREERIVKRRYAIAVTGNWGVQKGQQAPDVRLNHLQEAGFEEFQALSVEDFASMSDAEEFAIFDHNAILIESYRTGTQRYRRKCNECRFQLGQLRTQIPYSEWNPYILPHEMIWSFNRRVTTNLGTPKVPILRSRQLHFYGPQERHFPGFENYMPSSRPAYRPPVFRIYRENATTCIYTMYMTRCPICCTWQELRAFPFENFGGGDCHWIPFGNFYSKRSPEEIACAIDEFRCPQCFVKEYGERALGNAYRPAFEQYVDWIVDWKSFSVGAWDEVRDLLSKPKLTFWQKRKIQALLLRLPWDSTFGIRRLNLEVVEVNELRRRWDEWREIAAGLPDDVWSKEHDERHEYWNWLDECVEACRQEPERLARWALERDQRLLQ